MFVYVCVCLCIFVCVAGIYFILPERVYQQFEKIVGPVSKVHAAGPGIISIMTYGIGPLAPQGKSRSLIQMGLSQI
jgi:hypothetical protein